MGYIFKITDYHFNKSYTIQWKLSLNSSCSKDRDSFGGITKL